jgi:hypothetical protein
MSTTTITVEKTVITQTRNGDVRVKSSALANVLSTSSGKPVARDTNRPAPLMVPGV